MEKVVYFPNHKLSTRNKKHLNEQREENGITSLMEDTWTMEALH